MRKTKLISKSICLITLLICGYCSFAQTKKDSISKKNIDTLIIKEPNRLKFGCGFGLSFIGGTNISLSPNLTYKVSEKTAIGAGIQGSYAAIKNLQSTTTFGANLLAKYLPTKKITTLLEFAELKVSTKTDIDNSTKSYWDSALFVGLGYNITNKIAIGAKYNLLYKEGKSVYTSPVIPFVNITF